MADFPTAGDRRRGDGSIHSRDRGVAPFEPGASAPGACEAGAEVEVSPAPTILCDTTVASSLFAVDERSRQIEQHHLTAIRAISVVTLGEMRFGAIRAAWGETRRRALEDHLGAYVVLAVDSAVAELWARLRARCFELGRPKDDNDLWIAATARRFDLPLATLDRDQYDIPGLTVIRGDGIEVTAPE